VTSFGVLYVAFGAPYLGMAINSLLSVRTTNPDVPICVVTNVVPDAPAKAWWKPHMGDQWIFLPLDTNQNRQVKTRIYELSPFDRTLYLDCDTMVLGDLSGIQWPLDYFDVLICAGDNPEIKERRILGGRQPYSENGHFNGGVLCFKEADVVEEFFTRWQASFSALAYPQDQPSLMEAICLSRARIFPLSTQWNSGDRWLQTAAGRNRVVVWHYKMRLEPLVERTMSRAVRWYGADENHLAETRRFIRKRRASKQRGFFQWNARRIVTRMRGELSWQLARHPNRDQWLSWINEE
jgi:hypothetical protein